MSLKLCYVKMGTMPYEAALIKGKRTLPKEGDTVQIRYDNGDKSLYSNPWKWVKIDKVNENCFFVHGVHKP